MIVDSPSHIIFHAYLVSRENKFVEADAYVAAESREEAIAQAVAEFGWPRSRTRATTRVWR